MAFALSIVLGSNLNKWSVGLAKGLVFLTKSFLWGTNNANTILKVNITPSTMIPFLSFSEKIK